MTALPQLGAATAADVEPGWVTLFNSARFHALNAAPGERPVRIGVCVDDREIGAISGVISGTRFVNGHSAPFGGIDLARDRETPANVQALVTGAMAQLADLGVREIEVRARPSCYGASEPLLLFTLLNHGFEVARAELNQHIDLDGLGSAEDYLATLRSPARRALKHLAQADFTLHEAQTADEWDRAYAILAANRAAKGRVLSLSREYVETARHALAPAIAMFELRVAARPCAAALIYRVAPGRELVVAWGDSGHALERSPMNMVALAVVQRALADGVKSLDLGISNEPDLAAPLAVNSGLAQFKQSVGAQTEPRLRLTRRLG